MKRLNAQARITEVNDICHRIVVLYKQKTWNDAFLKQMMDGIEQRTTMLTEIINQDVALSKLDEADQKRDASVKALNKILEGYRVMPLPTLQAHAEQLAAVFGKYGTRIADENYTTESSLIEALLSDLSAPALQTAIGALTGVSEIIARLRSEQNEFTQLRVEYEKAVAQQKKGNHSYRLETLATGNPQHQAHPLSGSYANGQCSGVCLVCQQCGAGNNGCLHNHSSAKQCYQRG